MSVAFAFMTEPEARACVEAIHRKVEDVRGLVFDLHERRGWKALGYGSWRECVVTEFDQSKSQLYRQLQAALIEREISPMGEIGHIPERQLRPLAELPAGERKPVWEKAVETAPNGKPTTKHVETVVAEMTGKSALPGTPKPVLDLFRAEDDRRQAEVEEGPAETEEEGTEGADEVPPGDDFGGDDGREQTVDPAAAAERRCKYFLKCLNDVDDLTRAVAARVRHGGYDGFPAILSQLKPRDVVRVRGKIETLVERLQGWVVLIQEGPV